MKTMKEIFDEISHNSLTPLKLPNGKFLAYTDKNSNHCYIDMLYEDLFKDIRATAEKILEIGIYGGGSMVLWQEYFEKAHIYGIDLSYYVPELQGQERMTQIIGDAYSDQVAAMFADNAFDIVIDDGPHTVESFIVFIKNYLPKVKKGGYFIIEDIPDINIVPELISNVPNELQNSVQVYDFRFVKNLFDDIMLVIRV